MFHYAACCRVLRTSVHALVENKNLDTDQYMLNDHANKINNKMTSKHIFECNFYFLFFKRFKFLNKL